MPTTGDDLADALGEILSPDFGTNVQISNLKRLTGGTSHDSWAFDASDGAGASHALILRRDFSDELLDLPLTTEFALISLLHTAGVAVPRPLVLVESAGPLGSAGIISERLDGGDVRKMMARQSPVREGLALSLVDLLARLHQLDWRVVLGDVLPDPGGNAARRLVDHWARTAAVHVGGADPLLCAAIAWLQRRAPASTPLALVHGDFKANNLVWDGVDRFAIIDWELAHIGDPLEDVAWTMLWTTPHDLVGGMLDEAGFLSAYATATGVPVDRDRLDFWRLFVLVKLEVIFLKSMRLRGGGRRANPTHVMLERAIPWLHRQISDCLTSALQREMAA
jgi:aminoglycoside phosphotransferase (APT) family kinase protein